MYRPINCSFYDLLEEAATLAADCTIICMANNRETTFKGRIEDLYMHQKVEYLRLDSGEEIRLDSLVSVNGIPLKGFNGERK